MFWENVKIRITAVAIQYGQAQKKDISNIAKSAYYRSATMLASTIVEGMVYQLVKENTKTKRNIISNIKQLKKLHSIPKAIFNRKNIFICKESEKDVHIDDDGVTFDRLNAFLKNKGIITAEEFKKLDYVRVERNKLHLQGLNKRDTGYTKSKLKKASDSIDFLSKKLQKFSS